MQLKILFENIKHHLILSLFIIFTAIVILTSITLSIEANSFLYHATSDEYSAVNHDMDIIIKSNTGLSLKGTRGDNLEYDLSYERRNAFYNVTLLAKTNSSTNVIQIFEGSNSDINSAFNKNLNINDFEIVITYELANKLQVTNNDLIDLYIGDKVVKYKVVDIIEGSGMYQGESAFITGYNVAEHYALKKMYNLIMLDVKDAADFDVIYNHIKIKYNSYSIININDTQHIESLSNTSLDETLMIITVIFIIILIILFKMFNEKTKKQKEYFILIGKNNFYKSYQLLAWLLLLITSLVFSILLANLFINIMEGIYNCRVPYSINIMSYIYSLIPLLVVLLFRVFNINFKKLNFNKIYIIILITFTVICSILMICFKDNSLFSLFLLVFIIGLCLLIIEIVYRLSKYFLSFIQRIYIYDINKKTVIFRLLQFIYVFIIVIISLILSTLNTYTVQTENLSDLIKIDTVVATKTVYNKSDSYDQIQIDNNVTINETNLSIVLGLSHNQYEEYLDYPSLTNEEKEKFSQDKKYIILSKYFENTYHFEVGDKVELLINEKVESFEILKFVNHIYYKFAIVNHSDNMYYGYVIDSNNLKDDLISSFNEYKYSIINFKDSIIKHQDLYNNVLQIVKYTLVIIIGIIILLSIYIAYEEHLYQEVSLKKLKLLGLCNKQMTRISIIKFIYNLLICSLLGFIFSSIILSIIDDVAGNFNTIFYIEYDFKIVLISTIITSMCLFISFIYSNIKYRKI